MDAAETRQKPGEIFDENGSKLCDVWYDEKTGKISEIETKPYENAAQEAEHPAEHVYVTDDGGRITPERLIRKEVRAQKKRYLIVTSIIFHNGEKKCFLQQRSEQKELDPGKLSASAHGVAKEVRQAGGQRIEDIESASIINMALEINEELRHGAGTKQFHIKMWYGTKQELFTRAEKEKFHDANTIYLMPVAFLPADGYPLGAKQNPRSRALFAGYIFSDEIPTIEFDKSEMSKVEMTELAEARENSMVTDDLKSLIEKYYQ